MALKEARCFAGDVVPDLPLIARVWITAKVVVSAGDRKQLRVGAPRTQRAVQMLGLFVGDGFVRCAMDDQERRAAGSNVSKRAGSAQLFEVRAHIAADQRGDWGWPIDLHGTTRSSEVARPADGDDRLDVISGRALTRGSARAKGGQADQGCQVPAGGVSPDTYVVRI